MGAQKTMDVTMIRVVSDLHRLLQPIETLSPSMLSVELQNRLGALVDQLVKLLVRTPESTLSLDRALEAFLGEHGEEAGLQHALAKQIESLRSRIVEVEQRRDAAAGNVETSLQEQVATIEAQLSASELALQEREHTLTVEREALEGEILALLEGEDALALERARIDAEMTSLDRFETEIESMELSKRLRTAVANPDTESSTDGNQGSS